MLSQIASAESDLQQASHSFRRAIELDPSDSVSATLLGQLETRMEQQ
jgi:cytochrome c-type biogenesis protein CcmH/NrfG